VAKVKKHFMLLLFTYEYLCRGVEEVTVAHPLRVVRLQNDALQGRVCVGVAQTYVGFELVEQRDDRLDVTVLGGQVKWRHLAIVGEARDLHVDVARVARTEHLQR